MTELLKEWLNDRVGLSQRVTSLEADFADGYLLGELLAHYGAQGDFNLFTRSSSKLDARVGNWNRLHASLSALGIRLASNTANDIMTEKRGVVGKLLYHIKMTVSGMAPTTPSQRRLTAPWEPRQDAAPLSHGRRLDRRSLRARRGLSATAEPQPAAHGAPPPTSAALAARSPHKGHSASGPGAAAGQAVVSLPPLAATGASATAPQYAAMEKRLFQTRLRDMQSVSQSGNAALSTVVKRFADHRRAHDARVHSEMLRAEHERTAQFAEARRRELAARAERARASAAFEEQSKLNHEKAMTLRLERERTQRQFELTRKYKTLAKVQQSRAAEAAEVNDEIESFEKNIRRMGVGEKENKAMEDELHDPSKILTWAAKAKLPPVEHMRRIRSMVPTRSQMEEASASYLASIQASKRDEVEARKERQKRRRKVLLEQQKAHLDMEEKRVEQLLLSKLMRQSQAEAQLAHNLLKTRYEKQVIYANRVFRESQYAARRQADFEAALERDKVLTAAAADRYRAQVLAEKERHAALLRANAAEKYAANYAVCEAVTHALVDLSIKVAEYRYMTDNLVPAAMMSEWVACFVAGMPLFKPAVLSSPPPTPDKDASSFLLTDTADNSHGDDGSVDAAGGSTATLTAAAEQTGASLSLPPGAAPGHGQGQGLSGADASDASPPASPRSHTSAASSKTSRRRSSKHSHRRQRSAGSSAGSVRRRHSSSRGPTRTDAAEAAAGDQGADSGGADESAAVDDDDASVELTSARLGMALPEGDELKEPPVPPTASSSEAGDSLPWGSNAADRLAAEFSEDDLNSDGRDESKAGDFTPRVFPPALALTPRSAAAAAAPRKTPSQRHVAAVLDALALDEYLSGTGEWLFDGPPLSHNRVLGDWVRDLIALAVPPPPPPPKPVLPPFPLKVAILGKPLTGKSYMARRLAQVHSMEVLTPVGVVEWALAAAPAPGESGGTDDFALALAAAAAEVPALSASGGSTVFEASGAMASNKPRRRSRGSKTTAPPQPDYASMSLAQLAAATQAALAAGAVVPDPILVALFVARIRALDNVSGWVLDGFPATLDQAKLLEAALSGYEEPGVSGASHRRTGGSSGHSDSRPFAAAVKRGSARKSRIAPPTEVPDPVAPPPVSHMDLVIDLDVDDDAIFRRALGRVVDPVTNLRYHIEFDPPPSDAGIADRLEPVDDPERTREQLIHRLAVHGDAAPQLAQWFSSFQDLYARVPVYDSLEDSFKVVFTLLDARIAARREAEAAAAAAAAAEAAAAATTSAAAPEEPLAATAARLNSTSGAPQTNADESELETSRSHVTAVSATGSETAWLESGYAAAGGESSRGRDDEVDEDKVVGETALLSAGTLTLEEDAAHMLLEQWFTLESVYTQDARLVFRHLRELRYEVVHHLHDVRSSFAEFLRRPAQVTAELVASFTTQFNAMEADLRLEPAAKAELFQQTDDLKEVLWTIADTRLVEAEAERALILNDRWLENTLAQVTNLFIRLVQLEVDRFQASSLFLHDLNAVALGLPLPDGMPERVELPTVAIQPLVLLDRSAMLGASRSMASASSVAAAAAAAAMETNLSVPASAESATPSSRRKGKSVSTSSRRSRRAADGETEAEVEGGETGPDGVGDRTSSPQPKRRSHRSSSSRTARATPSTPAASTSAGGAVTAAPAKQVTLEDLVGYEQATLDVLANAAHAALTLTGLDPEADVRAELPDDGGELRFGELGELGQVHVAWVRYMEISGAQSKLNVSVSSLMAKLAEASQVAASSAPVAGLPATSSRDRKRGSSRRKETAASAKVKRGTTPAPTQIVDDFESLQAAMVASYATAFAAGLVLGTTAEAGAEANPDVEAVVDDSTGGSGRGETVPVVARWRATPSPRVLGELFPLGACQLLFDGERVRGGGRHVMDDEAGGALASMQKMRDSSPLVVAYNALPEQSRRFVRARYSEAVVFSQRVGRLFARGNEVVGRLGAEARTTYTALDETLGARFRKEVGAVNALVHHARVAIETEQYLEYQLNLEDTHFVIDKRLRVREAPPPPPAPPVRESLHERRFTVKQLLSLCLAFSAEAPGGMVAADDFVLLILRLQAASAHGQPALPKAWLDLPRQRIELLASIIDVNRTGSVDWRELVVLLALPYYPSLAQLRTLKRAYAAHDHQSRGRVSREAFASVPLFFEHSAMCKLVEAQRAEDEAAAEAAAAEAAAHGDDDDDLLPPSPGPMAIGRSFDPETFDSESSAEAAAAADADAAPGADATVDVVEVASTPRGVERSVPLLELNLEHGVDEAELTRRSNLTTIGLETPLPEDPQEDTGFPRYYEPVGDAALEAMELRYVTDEATGFDRAGQLKELFAFMFLDHLTPAESGGVDYVSLLRYLCRDVSGLAAVRKAWLVTAAVASNSEDASGEQLATEHAAQAAAVSIIQLKSILEHATMPSSVPEDDNPFSRKGLHQVYHELGLAPSAKVTFDETVGSSLAPLLTPVMYAYTRKATHLVFEQEQFLSSVSVSALNESAAAGESHLLDAGISVDDEKEIDKPSVVRGESGAEGDEAEASMARTEASREPRTPRTPSETAKHKKKRKKRSKRQ
ncbi:KPL2 protein isoform 1 [Thecamonas trahens ATCC 50062]|uniref:KPL2 protein isoform 1 n=1 Tax=Thecamonas trahens ATCC 50062 TaxID=461836 RepID=A0A0L0DFD9_THETB|nr:KPL2 protein isoform 1 [Thecamonas trahens ATCC 50062]KNC51004.1 KPL2 protein isoform 1 [Thecamonas trahens ATCC 50062]|eukprot:XP_013756473.1 KPL2 protein isoform 1 [Thecamonas trahens ATCC 50062]